MPHPPLGEWRWVQEALCSLRLSPFFVRRDRRESVVAPKFPKLRSSAHERVHASLRGRRRGPAIKSTRQVVAGRTRNVGLTTVRDTRARVPRGEWVFRDPYALVVRRRHSCIEGAL